MTGATRRAAQAAAEAPAAPQLRDRKEIPDRFKWNLTHIFPDWDSWKAAYDELEKQIAAFGAMQGTLGQGPAGRLDGRLSTDDMPAGTVSLFARLVGLDGAATGWARTTLVVKARAAPPKLPVVAPSSAGMDETRLAFVDKAVEEEIAVVGALAVDLLGLIERETSPRFFLSVGRGIGNECPGSVDTAGHASGTFTISHISWDQNGKHYDCAGKPVSWTATR